MNLVSKALFAEQLGVHPSQVTRWCKDRLSEGVVRGKVDLDHPVIRRWVDNHQARADDGRTAAARQSTEASDGESNGESKRLELDEYPGFEDIERVGEMKLWDVASTFGAFERYKAYLDASRIHEDAVAKRLKNEATKGLSVSKEVIEVAIFGALENLSLRLLGDSSKTIARIVSAQAKAETTMEEREAAVRNHNAKLLNETKAKVTKFFEHHLRRSIELDDPGDERRLPVDPGEVPKLDD